MNILQTGILQICLFYFADIDLCMSRGEWSRRQNCEVFLCLVCAQILTQIKFSENQIRGPRADRRYADYRKCADIGSIATLNVLTLVSFFCFIDF